jgi:predicted SprT family Zn-dependent metalloprotease
MDTQYLQNVANRRRDILWNKACAIWPILKNHPVPNIKLNNRLKVTGGRAWAKWENVDHFIDLSTELFWEYTETYIAEIIPHEMAHLVDFIVNGIYWNNIRESHGDKWQDICVKLRGYTLPEYHRLVNTKHAARKAKVI